MHLSTPWLLWWLTAAASAQAPAVPVSPEAPAPSLPEEFRAARIEVVGFDDVAVLAALRLRLPRSEVMPHGGPPPAVTPHVYVKIARELDGAGRVQAITSDGRAYARSFVIEVGQEVRVAASTAANLLFSIEQGAVAPVEENVAIPGEAIPAAVDPPPQPEPEPVPPPKPEPTPPTPTNTPPLVAPAGWELTTGVGGVAVLGVGPIQHGGVFVGAGPGLEIEGRSPRGGLIALDVRGLGRVTPGFSVGRVRVALAGGYAWRRGRFELPVLIGATIEPWWTTRSGAAAPVFAGSSPTTRPPLIGGLVRVTPALRLALERGPLAAVRIGPRLELAGSFAIDEGATEVGLSEAESRAMVRLGGLELALGLEVALQWSVARPQRR